MASDSSAFPDEQQILDLLKGIEKDCASDKELANIMYELKALVSLRTDDPTSTITDSYTALKQSERYSSIALSLVCMIVKHVMSSPKPVSDVQSYISRMPTYETEVKIPRLLLRRSLGEIAHDLDKNEAKDFISVAAQELKPLNPDRLGKSPGRILKLFERMEEKDLVSHTSKELPIVAQFLGSIKRPDLIQTLKGYDPDRTIHVAVVVELQSKFLLKMLFGGGDRTYQPTMYSPKTRALQSTYPVRSALSMIHSSSPYACSAVYATVPLIAGCGYECK